MAKDTGPDDFLKALGARIRDLRVKRGWTLEDTEDHGFTAWRHLQKIESGKNFTITTLWRVSKMFRMKPWEVLRLDRD